MADEKKETELITAETATNFTDDEVAELNKYIEDGGPKIAEATANNFMVLYLEGRSIDQIHSRFPQWPRGALLRARYDYKWDAARNTYVQELTKQVGLRLAKVKGEVIQFLLDSLAVTHKEFARQMEIYLQNPCEDNLPANRIRNLKEYRETIKTLGEALGIGQAAPGAAAPGVAVQINAGEGSIVKITAGEHSQALKQLAEGKDEPK